MPEEATLDRQEAFLEAFIESRGNLETARTEARVVKKTFYEWLQHDEIFRERFDTLRVMLAEELESEAVKRTLDPNGQRGSDAMLTTLLKGLKKERYGDDKGNQGIQQVIYVSNLRELPRPGVKELADHSEVAGRGGRPVEGDRVPDEARPNSSTDRTESRSPRVDAPADESREWRSVG